MTSIFFKWVETTTWWWVGVHMCNLIAFLGMFLNLGVNPKIRGGTPPPNPFVFSMTGFPWNFQTINFGGENPLFVGGNTLICFIIVVITWWKSRWSRALGFSGFAFLSQQQTQVVGWLKGWVPGYPGQTITTWNTADGTFPKHVFFLLFFFRKGRKGSVKWLSFGVGWWIFSICFQCPIWVASWDPDYP